MIDLWLKRKAATLDFQPKTNKPPRSDRKISDWDKFREFSKVHGDKTQKEMAELWNSDISARTISRALKKIGFTRKKNDVHISGERKSETKTENNGTTKSEFYYGKFQRV